MAARPPGRCTYCQRDLTRTGSKSRTALTWDHVMPLSAGGRRKVRCCAQCNGLKGDIHPSVWRWFTGQYPGWWRSFSTNAEVIQACRVHWGPNVRASLIGPVSRGEMQERFTQPLDRPTTTHAPLAPGGLT